MGVFFLTLRRKKFLYLKEMYPFFPLSLEKSFFRGVKDIHASEGD